MEKMEGNTLVFSIVFNINNQNKYKMNKTQLVAALASKAGISKANSSKYVNTMLGIIADNLCEGDREVAIPDFGRFFIKHMAERKGVNPATGETITIEARDKVAFKASDNISIYSRKHG
jgi:nucleoid DNA-binding protein